jgi:hypothetical protein
LNIDKYSEVMYPRYITIAGEDYDDFLTSLANFAPRMAGELFGKARRARRDQYG